MLIKTSCGHCEDGRTIHSRHGGNDPDTWDGGPCHECAGTGTIEIDDKGLIASLKLTPIHFAVTHPVFKTVRRWDWSAQDALKDGPDDPIGYGYTEAEAIQDLIEWIEAEAEDAAIQAVLDADARTAA